MLWDLLREAMKALVFFGTAFFLVFLVSVLFVADMMIRMAAKYRRKYQTAPADSDESAASAPPTQDFKMEKIWLDNPLFFLFRKWVCQLDNALFNRNGAAGPNYRPTRFVLVLPFWSGLISVLFFILADAVYNQDNAIYFLHDLMFCFYVIVLPLTVAVNMFFTCRNAFVIRGWIRKALYPVFLAACSVTTLMLTFWGLLPFPGLFSSSYSVLKNFTEIIF